MPVLHINVNNVNILHTHVYSVIILAYDMVVDTEEEEVGR